MILVGEASSALAFKLLASHSMKYSRVKFRKDPDANVIAFEKCGCEATVNAFRPCWKHQGDTHQAARLKAEALYHSVQKPRMKDK